MSTIPSQQTPAFKNENDHVNYLAMIDSARNCLIALPIVMGLEAYMMIVWLLQSRENPRSIAYPICYIELLCVCTVVLSITFYVRKDMEKRYKLLLVTQNVYAVLFILWSLCITTLDAVDNNFLSIIVYMTIAILVPVMCFIRPLVWIPIYFASGLYIIYLAFSYRPHLIGFITNFVIFSVMAFVAQYACYIARRRSFVRQIELSKLAEENYQYAYIDSLTGLYNRRSYTERMDALEKAGSLPDDLIIVSFDVNGLKAANDNYGHLAGDALLINAGRCIREAFGDYGTLYRTGGDEFIAILLCSCADYEAAVSKFKEAIAHTTLEQVGTLSVSLGSAAASDHPEASLGTLSKTADDAMYLDKRRYYSSSGVDRRHR